MYESILPESSVYTFVPNIINSGTFETFRMYSSHEEMNPKRRNTMEDCYRIVPNLIKLTDNNDPSITSTFSYFGVYDGHGGRNIVDFLDETLEKNIAIELSQPDDATIPVRLSRAFLITDMQSRRLDITTSGATAVCCLLKKDNTNNNRTLYCANVGDSRAVIICQNGNIDEECTINKGYYAKRLSYDHRAEDENEQKRIKDAGGFVIKSRVLGILAVSRSFGDHGMKDFVTANPHVSEIDLNNNGDCPFLILACDGVWDVLTDKDAADLILNKYIECNRQPFDNAAHLLVQTAIEKGSMDNVTAIVIFL
jgi:serine/threonine protein phosphatase PrpC